MTPLINVVNRCFATEFYRMNSGFFLLIGTIAFGFMSSIEHIALAQYFISSGPTMMVPVGIWILYTIKIIMFNRHRLQLDENRFLYNLQYLRSKMQFAIFSEVILLQLLPAIVYGCFLIFIALETSSLQSIAVVIVALPACAVCAALTLTRSIKRPEQENRVSVLKRFLDRHYRRPLMQFYTESLLRNHPLTLVGVKILSGALLFAVCALYHHEAYDSRLLAMAITSCSVANVTIIYHLVNFENLEIAWIKNLPIPAARRYLTMIGACTLLLGPEIIVLLKNFPSNLPPLQMGVNVFFLISMAGFFVGFLHTRAAPLEYFTKTTFWFYTVLILMILFKVPVMLIGVLVITTGYALFVRNYYRFERAGR